MAQIKKQNSRFFKNYGVPFLLSFALVSGALWAIKFFNGANQLPPDIAIILSPHLDDAVLSLGGFMAERKTPVIVATFFTGKPSEAVRGGWDRLSGFKNSDEAMAARAKENLAALEKTGAYPLNLSYLDFQYGRDRNSVSGEKIAQSMKKDIETILGDLTDSAKISIYGPSEFGRKITHPDHKILHDAFTAVARENLGQKNLRFFFYEDFPYVARYEANGSTTLKNFLEEAGGFSLSEIPLPVGDAAFDTKIKAIGAYSSQDKAFESLGENIAQAVRDYARGRCRARLPSPFARPALRDGQARLPKPEVSDSGQACEVAYEILPL
ncbi:MAG: PIG-L family deacetylase [Candidatus Taylorbacteria bacterium]|nr:PIG-L family deacetylase [Candidatus Taylorbacteria bacterium]